LHRHFKRWCADKLHPRPKAGSERVATDIAEAKSQNPGLPFCPVVQGNLLYQLACDTEVKSAVEVGFATGSTALYMLEGLAPRGGAVTSIDFKQDDFGRLGERMVQSSRYRTAHALIEGNSNIVLPRLLADGRQFDLAFSDGWKVFDPLMLDVYYLARLLGEGGFLVLDDTRMRSTSKVIALLEGYYGFREVSYSKCGEPWTDRAFMALTTRSLHRPFRAFQKPESFNQLPALSQFDWWMPF
jgi:predicted O-methyltransferase YrrM